MIYRMSLIEIARRSHEIIIKAVWIGAIQLKGKMIIKLSRFMSLHHFFGTTNVQIYIIYLYI